VGSIIVTCCCQLLPAIHQISDEVFVRQLDMARETVGLLERKLLQICGGRTAQTCIQLTIQNRHNAVKVREEDDLMYRLSSDGLCDDSHNVIVPCRPV